MNRYHNLTVEEKKIIEGKSTEIPGTGELLHYDKTGVYLCKKCDAPLYLSSNKFESHCGWPSFDDEIQGAVKQVRDADGRRTEILCNRCEAHLGHVFVGEFLTEKNTRHCVNSLSMIFLPAYTEEGFERCYFAGGCFWGVEHLMKDLPGVIKTRVGFMGGFVVDPTYHEVCEMDTGHAEVIEVIFDPEQTSFKAIARYFFEIHDPFQHNAQGPDIGPQYRSGVYYLTEAQKNITLNLIEKLERSGQRVATEIMPASRFYEAEDYHQRYYAKTGHVPYCHVYTKRFHSQ